jgi:phage tail-like protein
VTTESAETVEVPEIAEAIPVSEEAPGPVVAPAGPLVPGGGGGDGSGGAPPAHNRAPEPPSTMSLLRQSSYLEYLPGVYHGNEFLGRFLLIVESILDPIDRQAANLHHYFDPRLAPPEMLSWLGSWLGLVMDERWPEERRRELVASAAPLYAWRGTKQGLRELLRLYTGIEPEIDEPVLSDVSRNLGLAYTFTVRLTVPADSPIDEAMVRRIVEAEKPAFAAATIEVRRG